MENVIDNINQLDFNKLYTYADYLLWQFEQRVELLKGKIFLMSPAPKRIHQEISGKFFFNIYQNVLNYNKKLNCNCKVYEAPFDVRLIDRNKNVTSASLCNHSNNQIYTVVQPDICVICDKSKLDDKGCIGAPDLIVEILSEGSVKKDLNIKFRLYEENGVKEYWVADPVNKLVHQYFLEESRGKYDIIGYFTEVDNMQCILFPELTINIKEIFED